MVEQPAFAVESAAVSVEGAVGCDDTVAWDDDADTVSAIGESDSTRSAGVAELGCELPVADGLPEGDLAQCAPDASLPFGARRVEGDGKVGQLTGKVRTELGFELIEDRVVALGHGGVEGGFEFGLFTVLAIRRTHFEQANAAVGRCSTQGAQWSFDGSGDESDHDIRIPGRSTLCTIRPGKVWVSDWRLTSFSSSASSWISSISHPFWVHEACGPLWRTAC